MDIMVCQQSTYRNAWNVLAMEVHVIQLAVNASRASKLKKKIQIYENFCTFSNLTENLWKFTEEIQKVGDVASAKPDILVTQPKVANCADVKVLVPKIMNAIVKLDNVNARRIMTDISVKSVRYVKTSWICRENRNIKVYFSQFKRIKSIYFSFIRSESEFELLKYAQKSDKI